MNVSIKTTTSVGTMEIGAQIGSKLKGGEVLVLTSDLGGGKTTFTKGLARALGIKEEVVSPTFTVEREYSGEKLRLRHYDFYRLETIGLMKDEIREALEDENTVVAIEWAKQLDEVVPLERTIQVVIERTAESEDARIIAITVPEKLAYVIEGAKL